MNNLTVGKIFTKFVGLLIFSLPVYSQADFLTLDNDFGVNGHLPYVGAGGNSLYNRSIEVTSADKIITLTSFDSAGLITQHLDDGTFDSTFGSGGTLYLTDTRLSDFAVQPDGKIIVVGQANISSSNNDLLIARYLANGTLDVTFGNNNGKTIIPNQSGLTGSEPKVAVQSDGGIVVSGGNQDIIVARFTPNGLPDLSFGNTFTFKAISDFGGRTEIAFDMTIDDQNRILVTGLSQTPPGQGSYDTRVIVVRYLPNGQLDKSFKDTEVYSNIYLCDLQASCGRQYIYPEDIYNPHQYPRQIIVKKANGDNLNGNKILITGKFGTARLAENGTFDQTFGIKGLVFGLARKSVAVRTDNKMVFLESNQNNKTIEIYKENGQLGDDVVSNDCVFDPSVNLSFQNYSVGEFSDLKLDSNDRIIVSGNGNETSQTNSNSAFLARYKYSKCAKSLKFRDYYEYNPFVHPLDKVGPIWGGLKNTTTNQYLR